jgi:hypothetical protein
VYRAVGGNCNVIQTDGDIGKDPGGVPRLTEVERANESDSDRTAAIVVHVDVHAGADEHRIGPLLHAELRIVEEKVFKTARDLLTTMWKREDRRGVHRETGPRKRRAPIGGHGDDNALQASIPVG